MVRSFLSAGIDTTVRAIGSGLYCFAQSPDQWQLLRDDQSLARPAFEEILRCESPFQIVFRTTTEPVELAGTRLPADQKILLSLGGGNRDPRKWDDPDRFDIRRRTAGHLGFGAGIHGCLGQMLARLEVEVLLTAMAKRVAAIEVLEPPEYLLNNTVRGFSRLVVRFHP
jgi:cytochrome P450